MRSKKMSTNPWARRLGLAVAMLGAGTVAQAAPAFVYTGIPGETFRVKFNGATTESNTTAGSNETTWGWGYVADIRNDLTNAAKWLPENPTYGNATISYMLYGIADLRTAGNSSNGFDIYNVGCTGGPCDGKIHIDFYIDDAGGTNPTFSALTPASRTGFDSLTGVTDGNLLMRWVLTPGGVTDDPATLLIDESQTTLYQDVSGVTLPATGSGFFYADCVDGEGCEKLGPGLTAFPGGPIAELFGRFTLNFTSGAVLDAGWEGLINDPVVGVTVAEPNAMAVFGAGLLALVGFTYMGRRRSV